MISREPSPHPDLIVIGLSGGTWASHGGLMISDPVGARPYGVHSMPQCARTGRTRAPSPAPSGLWIDFAGFDSGARIEIEPPPPVMSSLALPHLRRGRGMWQCRHVGSRGICSGPDRKAASFSTFSLARPGTSSPAASCPVVSALVSRPTGVGSEIGCSVSSGWR